MAVNSRELRLGNLLEQGEVIAIASGEIALDNGCGFFSEDALDPIPLSLELLEKCGFVKINSNVPELMKQNSFDGQRHFRYDFEGISISSNGSGFRWGISHIKHLHHLQNLFYSLTGHELQITL